MISRKVIITLLIAATVLMIILGLLHKPISQPQSYHHFADQRGWFGIVNFQNVLSNLPLALVGFWGLFLLLSPGKVQFIDRRERWPWIGVTVGFILAAFFSGYYHLAPDDFRLLWDRLPMTIVFMSFVSALICAQLSSRIGLLLWPILIFIGVFSVLLWFVSDDLRLYVLVQGYAVVVASILLLAPPHYTRTSDLIVVLLFYILAKLFELFDLQIYILDDGFVSGHTLKHLAVAMAAFWLLRLLSKRKIVISSNK